MSGTDPTRMLGRRIRDYRKRLGMTQAGLAERAGFNPATVIHIENGFCSTSIRNLGRLAAALGTTPGELLNPEPDGGTR